MTSSVQPITGIQQRYRRLPTSIEDQTTAWASRSGSLCRDELLQQEKGGHRRHPRLPITPHLRNSRLMRYWTAVSAFTYLGKHSPRRHFNTRTAERYIFSHFLFCLIFFYLPIKTLCWKFLTFANIIHIYSIQVLEAKTFLLLMPWTDITRKVEGSHWPM